MENFANEAGGLIFTWTCANIVIVYGLLSYIGKLIPEENNRDGATITLLIAAVLFFISIPLAFWLGGISKANKIEAMLTSTVDKHYMDKKVACTYTTEIKLEYFDGKFKKWELSPGSTKYVRP